MPKSILLLVRYPNSEDLRDGYFQRVRAIDNILCNYNRFYINYRINEKVFSFFPEIVKIKQNVFEIRPYVKNPLHLFLIACFAFGFGRVYAHSILRLELRFNRFLFLISKKRIIDLHGSVPEEFRVNQDLIRGTKFDKIEAFAVRYANIIISVTGKMSDHIIKKHHIKKTKNIIILPIFQNDRCSFEEKFYKKPSSVIYCGGLQKWQQVDKMLEYVHDNHKINDLVFIIPNPSKLIERYREKFCVDIPCITVSVEFDKVSEWYAKYSFGLILREDNIINNVACPTKLIEYLQNDIVPIVDSACIGDFKELGYTYVEYKKKLPEPEEWKRMIIQNRKVLNKIYDMFKKGVDQLVKGI